MSVYRGCLQTIRQSTDWVFSLRLSLFIGDVYRILDRVLTRFFSFRLCLFIGDVYRILDRVLTGFLVLGYVCL